MTEYDERDQAYQDLLEENIALTKANHLLETMLRWSKQVIDEYRLVALYGYHIYEEE